MKKKTRNIVIVSAVLIAAGALAVGGRVLQDRRGNRPKDVRVEMAKIGSITTTVSATGVVVSRENTEVRSEINAIVEEVMVEEGDWVEKGNELVILDDDDLQSRIKGARTALISAQSNLSQIESDTGSLKLRNRANVEGAQLALLEAKLQLDKLRDGPDAEALSDLEFRLQSAQITLSDAQEEYEYLKTTAQVEATSTTKGAEALVITSRKNLEDLREGPNKRTLANLDNSVEGARINLENATLAVESAKISVDKSRLALKNAESGAGSAKAALDDARRKADLTIERAKAALKASQSSVESASINGESAQLSMESARLGVKDAELNLGEAEKDLDRSEGLFKEGAVSQQQLSAARVRHEGTRTAYQVAVARHDQEKLLSKSSKTSFNQAMITIETSELDLKEAESLAAQLEAGDHPAQGSYEAALINLEGSRSSLLEAGNFLSQQEVGLKLYQANYEAARRQLELFKTEITDQDLKLAEARKDEAEANLEIARLGSDRNLAKVRMRFESAKLQYENALENLRLFKERITDKDITIAQARVTQAQANLDLALAEEAKGNEEDIKLARSQVSEAQSNLDILQSQLTKTIIRTPSAGTVIKRSVDPTSSVAPGSLVVTIADQTRLLVEADVDEVDTVSVDVGQKATIKTDAFIGVEFVGHVTEISPRAEKVGNINAIKTKVDIEQSEGRLKVGLTATVNIITDHREEVVFVPLEAIFEEKGDSENGEESEVVKKYIFVVDPDVKDEKEKENNKKKKTILGNLQKIEVITGLSNLNNMEIKSGLKEGDRVVVGNKDKLKDQDRVKVSIIQEENEG